MRLPTFGLERLAAGAAEESIALVTSVVGEVLDRIDVDALLARIDIDALLARVDIDALLARIDVDGIVARVDIDALLARVDVNGIVARVDLAPVVASVLDEVQMGELIRESTSSVADESIRAVRAQAVGADALVSRIADRILLRRAPRAVDPPGALRVSPSPG